MTLREAAQTAIDIQSACNLSGVAHSLADATSAVWDEARRLGKGTDFVNRHPVIRVFLAKLADLSGPEYSWPADAFAEVEMLAKQKPEPLECRQIFQVEEPALANAERPLGL